MEIIGILILDILSDFLLIAIVSSFIHVYRDIKGEDKDVNPILSFIGYTLLGAILGGISLWVFPELLFKTTLAIINLIFAPISIGIVMSLIGQIRRKKELDIIRLESFLYGWAFTFVFALIRYLALD